MKRYGDLFPKIIDKENLRLAHHNAQKGKKHYSEIQDVNANEDYYIDRLHQILIDKTFTTSQYVIFKITEPKDRFIYKLPYFPDRIVQHAIMQVCQPIWDKQFIYDSYAAVPGKGIHAGFYRLQSFLRDKENTQYCLKMDISKFYPNVNHNILIGKLIRKIKCKNTLWLFKDIVRSVLGEKGIPIGNYLSQYFSNIYLNDFDHWLKEQIKCEYYIRYCDDAVILHRDKSFLHSLWREIDRYLDEKLKLKLNRKSQIFPVCSRGIDFLGYRTFHNFSLLRKSSKRNFCKKVKIIEEKWKELKPQHIVNSLMSYVGWLEHCNSYNLLSKNIYDNRNILKIMGCATDQLGIANPILRLDRGW